MLLKLRAATRRKIDDQSGVSAIEFAIVFPIFILAVLGLFIYAVYFGTVHSVQQLAAEAARASVAGLHETERANLARQHVQRSAASYPLLAPRSLTVAASTVPGDTNLFRVELSYDASDLVIFAFSGLVPMPSTQIRREAVVRRGGY